MLLLSRKEVAEAIRQKKLPSNLDWYSGFVGLFLLLVITGTLTFTVLRPTSGQSQSGAFLTLAVSWAVCLYGLLNLLMERQLTPLTTHLSAVANHQLIIAAFERLGWPASSDGPTLILANIPSSWIPFSAAGNATVLIADQTVYLNLSNHNTYKSGRLPFSFGRNRRHLRLLIDTIRQMLPAN